jgi:hypothetical protein
MSLLTIIEIPMKNSPLKLAQILTARPRNVFLLDGLGALLSALLLVFLIAPFEAIFGMPQQIAYTLSYPAFGFMVYSLGCYFLNPIAWKPFMRLIALANFLYCCLTFTLVMIDFSLLTKLGVAYFLGEIGIVFGVIAIELLTVHEHSLK